VSSGVISIGAGTYLIRFYGYYDRYAGEYDIDYIINDSIVADRNMDSDADSGTFVYDCIHTNASGTDTMQINLDEIGSFAGIRWENVGVTIMKLGS
jgi:hypothetical protein